MSYSDLWLHKKVITISNGFQTDSNDLSLGIGTVVDLVPVSQSQNLLPMIKFVDDEEGEEPKLVFSTVLEYSPELWDALNKLTAEERWMLIQAFCYRYQSR